MKYVQNGISETYVLGHSSVLLLRSCIQCTCIQLSTGIAGHMYMLLHPVSAMSYLQAPRPEGVVLVNRTLHKQGCNEKFISD